MIERDPQLAGGTALRSGNRLLNDSLKLADMVEHGGVAIVIADRDAVEVTVLGLPLRERLQDQGVA